jgi:prevent-host-death family protein
MSGHICRMKTVSIREAKNRLTQLAREVERGETIVVTRNGSPTFELAPHRPRKGLRLEAIDEFKRKHGIETIVSFIANDFDQPLAEDFLLRPLPPGA